MKKLKANWEIMEDEGEGTSISGGKARNKKGLCASINCGVILTEEGCKSYVFGTCCPKCTEAMDEFLRSLHESL